MIGGRSGRRGARWPLFAALAVLSGATVIGSSLLASRSLVAETGSAEYKVERFVTDEIAPFLADVDLGEPVDGETAARLTTQLRRGVLSGGWVARVRVFRPDGILVYSSDDGDRVGSAASGNVDLVRAAAAGALASTPGTDQVVTDGRAQSLQLLQVYAPLEPGASSPATVGVDLRYRPIVAAASEPWGSIQLIAAIAAVVFVVSALFELARALTARSLAARSGFTGADASRAAARAAAKETKLRRGLEHQIETAREQLRAREAENAEAARQFATQLQDVSRRLEAAETRAEEAERRAATAPPTADPDQIAKAEERIREAQAELDEAMETNRRLEAELAEARAAADAQMNPPDVRTDAEIELLSSELERARSETEGLLGELEDARADVRDARVALEEAGAERASMSAKVAELEGAVAKTTELQQRAASVADLERRATDAEAALEGERQRSAATDDARAAFEAKHAVTQARIEGLVSELEAATERVEASERRLQEVEAQAEASASDMDAVRSALRDSQVSVERLHDEVRGATGERDAARAELAEAVAALSGAEDRIRRSDARAVAAEARSSAMTGELSTEAATMRAELYAERERARRAEARVAEVERRADELERHASSLAQALEDERVRRAEADRGASEVRTRVDDAELRSREAQERLAAFQEGSLAVAEQRDHALRGAERADAEAQRALERAQTLERTVQELTADLEAARVASETLRASAADDGARAKERIHAIEAELADRRAAAVEAETTAVNLHARSEDLEARARRAEMRILELEAVVAESEGSDAKIAELTAALQMRDALVRERDDRLVSAQERLTETHERLVREQERADAAEATAREAALRAEEAARTMPSTDTAADERVAVLERERVAMTDELEHMQGRLRRAYADAESLRAQLEAATPRMGLTPDAAAVDEIQRLRVELGQAIERAASAETYASRLQADLAEARAGDFGRDDAPEGSEPPQDDEDRSLRFRLARSAARKKGLDGDQMWS